MMPIQNSPKGHFGIERISAGVQGLTGHANGLVWTNPNTSLPGNVDGGVIIGIISNSTGVALAINTSGTTWKYLNVTTKQPT